VGEGIGFAEHCRQEPLAPLLPLICAARRGPTTKSWLAPPIRARDQAGRQRPSLWPLDARWGQSNRYFIDHDLRLIMFGTGRNSPQKSPRKGLDSCGQTFRLFFNSMCHLDALINYLQNQAEIWPCDVSWSLVSTSQPRKNTGGRRINSTQINTCQLNSENPEPNDELSLECFE
jgi:hypothetical protein